MEMQDDDGAPATKGDLRELREEMRTGTEGLRAELRTELQSEVGRLDQRIGEVHRSLAIEIVKTHERIDRVESNLRGEIRETRSTILKAVEDFAAQVGKTDRAQIIADWRLAQLEKRVATIESRSA